MMCGYLAEGYTMSARTRFSGRGSIAQAKLANADQLLNQLRREEAKRQ